MEQRLYSSLLRKKSKIRHSNKIYNFSTIKATILKNHSTSGGLVVSPSASSITP